MTNQESLTCRERFVRACRCESVDRPPIWMMRQAGRALPEYRAVKEKHSFVEIVQTPELATEVTLQPIRRFGFDAAILFSDILVVCEAMGQSYSFRETGGIEMAFPVQNAGDVDRLEVQGAVERLDYVNQAVRMIRRELDPQTALIGFSGSPWTLANFMMEGGSSREFVQAKKAMYAQPELFESLCRKLTDVIVDYLNMQIRAGVDAVQIFDTSGGTLAGNQVEQGSLRWIREIVSKLDKSVPAIVFSKGTRNWESLVLTGANILGVDWTERLSEVASSLPKQVGVQGNLDPAVLEASPEVAIRETNRILEEMKDRSGFIFNLGHGVRPSSQVELMQAVVETVQASASNTRSA
ncbi:MAG: uroporphyrinogen decarboxylase [Verrucomicrobia bacterium]|jgi:uroporphyrinogen decarboxylase|nr:uroporphyrinogen decarboxylase [Verrucomicrobiota bacterium]